MHLVFCRFFCSVARIMYTFYTTILTSAYSLNFWAPPSSGQRCKIEPTGTLQLFFNDGCSSHLKTSFDTESKLIIKLTESPTWHAENKHFRRIICWDFWAKTLSNSWYLNVQRCWISLKICQMIENVLYNIQIHVHWKRISVNAPVREKSI